MSPAARTVVSMQLSQASKLCHRRAAARPLSRTSDKPSRRSGNSLRPPRALPCFSRPLNVKRCLPEAPASNDVYLTRHQAWITCQKLPPLFSAGSKVIRGIIAQRRESLGTRLKSVCVHLAGGKSAAVPLYHVLFQNFKAQRTRLAE